jgi:pilus assembly protein CpaF
LATTIIRSQLFDIIFGFGPLEDLMAASDINDIMVLPSGKIFIERSGKMQDTGRRMLTPEVSLRIVERAVSEVGRRLDQTTPMVDARIDNGSRLNAIIAPLSVDGPALTIRRFPDRPKTLADLVRNATMSQVAANFLQACILARKNMVISGGTGSGKTTLLNALASMVPQHERIVTIEDTKEIQLLQPHVIYLQARPPNQEEKNSVTIRQLVSNALRMRPDRILVGECRGAEALDMLQAMNTGHDGSLTTIHANTPADALRRLEVLSISAVDLPSRALREQIASAVDVVVQIERLKEDRRVVSIAEIVSFDEDGGSIIVEEIFCLRRANKKRLVQLRTGQLAFTGYIPTFIDELRDTNAFKIQDMF